MDHNGLCGMSAFVHEDVDRLRAVGGGRGAGLAEELRGSTGQGADKQHRLFGQHCWKLFNVLRAPATVEVVGLLNFAVKEEVDFSLGSTSPACLGNPRR